MFVDKAYVDNGSTVKCRVSWRRKIFLTTTTTLKSFAYGRRSLYVTLCSSSVLRRFFIRWILSTL